MGSHMIDRIMQRFQVEVESEPDKCALIHQRLDLAAHRISWCLVYILVSVYVLSRKAFGLSPILDQILNSQVVDVLLLKVGAVMAYIIAWYFRADAPRKRPATPLHGRRDLRDYLGKHRRILLWALKISLAIELIIDLFYFL
jgi:hypothetical protein